MATWTEVLIALIEGPRGPLHGEVESTLDETRVFIASAPLSAPLHLHMPRGTVRVWVDGNRTRIESPDGSLRYLCDGTTAWQFRGNEELPDSGPAHNLTFVGPGRELLLARSAGDWFRANDFNRPTKPIEDIEFLGRPCWEVELAPPAHKPQPMQMVVDQATGAVLQIRSDASGAVIGYTSLIAIPEPDPDLFTWHGESRTPEQRRDEMMAEHDARLAENQAWFGANVGPTELTFPMQVKLSVGNVGRNDETGEIHAMLDGDIDGQLARRPRSAEDWNLQWGEAAHRWSTENHDWAVLFHRATVSDDAIRVLRRQLGDHTA